MFYSCTNKLLRRATTFQTGGLLDLRVLSAVNHLGGTCFLSNRPDAKSGYDLTKKQKKELQKLRKKAERLAAQKRKEEKKEKRADAVYTVFTAAGEKKDTSLPLPASYSPQYVEAVWYDWWEKQGFFSPDYQARSEKEERFVICLPPPNVTGTLHLGHALGNSIQDALCRWHRMSGREVLWNPGSDHAGIATQVAVEKQLMKEEGKTRQDVGREEFVKRVWLWKTMKGGVMSEQMRRLGSSLDWSRDCFTLDPKLTRAVNEAFIRLHDEGLIYRSHRLVHWCCHLQSALSDIEVDNTRIEGSTYLRVPGYDDPVLCGQLVNFAYPITDSVDEVVVSTSRVETMLGDTGVAVHPDDPRYTRLHGRTATHPLTGQKLPIICDEHVDRTFGTGAVKLTPAHDHTDYELGVKHGLDCVNILSDDGHLINVPQPYLGMRRFTARRAVVEALRQCGLYRGASDHAMTLPLCSRSGDIIEPLLKPQWYVDTSDMLQKAAQVVRDGELELIPDYYQREWTQWLDTARDWCISRQLWWGHQIPAYRVTNTRGSSDGDVWVSAHSEDEARTKASHKLNIPPDDITLQRDEDVLDTWFSSALFPFSIFGWPDQTADLARFYPLSLLETASDIMYFWVARMVMMGQHLTGQLPFKQVLFHSVLRDAYGRKMSKSLGNVIDPIDVIQGASLQDLQDRLASSNLDPTEVKKAMKGKEMDFPLGIPPCGADALRFTLCSYNFKGHFCNVDVNNMKTARSFCNKIWQAFRYSMRCLGDQYTPPDSLQLHGSESHTDLWMLSCVARLTETCERGFKSYDLHHVTEALETFWWSQFCDVYIEYTKSIFQSASSQAEVTAVRDVIHTCLDVGLRALSPFMPYLTEELYQRLPRQPALQHTPSVTVSPYPAPALFGQFLDPGLEQEMSVVRTFVRHALSARKSLNLTKQKAHLHIVPCSDEVRTSLHHHSIALTTLSKSTSVHLLTPSESPPVDSVCHQLDDGSQLYLDLKS